MPVYQGNDGTIREGYYETSLGLDTTSSHLAMNPRSLRRANNADISEANLIEKRRGYENSFDGNEWSTNVVTQGLQYQKTSSTEELLLFGHTTTANTGKVSITDATVSQISSDVVTGLDNARPSLLQFEDLVFFFNGDTGDEFLYDGTNDRQIGITAPTNAPSSSAGTGPGDLVEGGSYIYAYTYYNSTTGAESSPSPLSTAFVATSSQEIDVSVTAGDSTTADTIRLYRTTANGATLLLDTTAGIAATSITSDKADSALAQELELDNERLSEYGTFRVATVVDNRIFGLLHDNLNRVRFSAIGFEGPMPESYRASHFVDCKSDRGLWDTNVTIGSAGAVPIVLKKNSVGFLDQLGFFPTGSVSDNVVYEYRELAKNTTTAGRFCHTNVFDEMLWLGRDNIYATTGRPGSVRSIADGIVNDIKSLSFNDDDELSAVTDTNNKRVYFSAKTTGAGAPNWVIVGHYHNYPNFAWTIYKPGTNSATHPGLNVGSFVSYRESTGEITIYFGNNNDSGDFYKMNTGHNDDSSGIDFDVIDAPSSFGLPEEFKDCSRIKVLAEGDGNDYPLTVASLFDLDTESEAQQNISLKNGTPAVWDTGTWDESEWTSSKPVFENYNPHIKAYFQQARFTNSNADEPIIIHGYTKISYPGENK